MPKEGFIYIWYDRKRKMYYIGCHWGTIGDGYICSSNRMRDAYRRRPQDFKRRILKKGIAREDLLSEEYKWLTLIPDEQLGKKYYNHSKKHFGHWSANPKQVQSMRERNLGKNNPMYGKKHTEEWKKAAAERMKGNSYTLGTTLTEEHKQKVSEGLKKAYKNGFSPTKGRKHTKKWKKQMSDRTSGSKNPSARNIITPYGTFGAITVASQALGMSPYQIRKMLKDEKYFDWEYA